MKNRVSVTSSSKRILLVEDNLVVQKAHHFLLESMGYQVTAVSTGNDALKEVKEGYDLVVLDIGLPDINGIEVCKQIRNTFKLVDLPIVALSALHNTAAAKQGLDAGINAFIGKPISFANLQPIIKYWLNSPRSEILC